VHALRWTLSEALAAAEASPGELRQQIGLAIGVPVVVVQSDGRPAKAGEAARVAAGLAGLPAVTIAAGMTHADPAGFDVDSDDPEPLVSAVLAHPTAAVVAAQVLRVNERLPAADGLVVESLAYATLQSGPEHQAWLARRGRKVRNDLDRPRLQLIDPGGPDGTDGPLELVLDRPRLHNLMDSAMRDQLADALRTVAAIDPPRRLLWRANGPSFCAGGDPAEFGSVADPAAAHTIRSSAGPAALLASISDRVSVVIEGPAVGAGIELAAFCADVTAGPGARFALPELAMGLIPGAGGTVSIPLRIGRQRTLQWLLLGSEIDPPTAQAWGLVDRLR